MPYVVICAVGEVCTETVIGADLETRWRSERWGPLGYCLGYCLGFRYQLLAGPEELGNGGRIQWVSGRPGEPPAYAGTDFIVARDGRIAAVYLFFDKLS
jgi:hypothetical protein